MPCWMTATGSLTSQDSSMDVVMQYKTIISTIRREDPMPFRSKSKIVGIRQMKLCKEEQWVRVPELNLRKADNSSCSICISFWSYLNRQNGRMVQSSFQNRTTHSFQSAPRIWATSLPLCVCRCWKEENWESSSGPLLCCDSSVGIVQPCVSGVHLCSWYVTEQQVPGRNKMSRVERTDSALGCPGIQQVLWNITLLWVFFNLNSWLCS